MVRRTIALQRPRLIIFDGPPEKSRRNDMFVTIRNVLQRTPQTGPRRLNEFLAVLHLFPWHAPEAGSCISGKTFGAPCPRSLCQALTLCESRENPITAQSHTGFVKLSVPGRNRSPKYCFNHRVRPPTFYTFVCAFSWTAFSCPPGRLRPPGRCPKKRPNPDT